MLGSSFLLVALLALSPRSTDPSDAVDHAHLQQLSAIATHPAVVNASERVTGLSGFALSDTLDEVATSDEFWSGAKSMMAAFADSELAPGNFAELAAEPHLRLNAPGIDPALIQRALDATLAVVELIPADLNLAELLQQVDGPGVAKQARDDLSDGSIPVAIRRMQRRALRGTAASFVLTREDPESDPVQYAALLVLLTEGMENTIRLAVVNGEENVATQAEALLHKLGLPSVDREALKLRAQYLETAREQLASTAHDLDGRPLRLPPDPGLRDDDC